MNTMRVFLHDLLWQQDAEGFKQRLNQFLDIAAKHRIKPIFVLFDSVWDPNPQRQTACAPTWCAQLRLVQNGSKSIGGSSAVPAAGSVCERRRGGIGPR